LNSEFLNIQEVSQYLGIKAGTLYALAESRAIPPYKIGRLVRFRKSEIDHWMLGNKRECLPSGKVASRFLGKTNKNLNIGEIIRKSIDKSKRERYNSPNGKPDRVKGLRKEVRDGSV
jgi:excisionase family DNA binding protein